MSTYISTTFGKISGRHGTAVAAIYEGEPVLKVFTPPSNPRTSAQVANRAKFAFTQRHVYPLRPVLSVTYGRTATGFGQAFSAAWYNAVTGSYPELTFEWSQMPVSYGLIVRPMSVSATLSAGNQLAFAWSDQVYDNCAEDDKLFIVLYDADSSALMFHRALANRVDGSVVVTLPEEWQLANLKVWMFFSTVDLLKYSPSVYVTVTEQP